MEKIFIVSELPEPHKIRNGQILQKYPEIKKLFGPDKSTVFYVFGLVATQIALALLCRDLVWWQMLLVAYFVGAFINHAMFVLIHDCTHNLVLKGSTPNRLLGMVADLPIGFPMAMSFRKYHLIHHKHQGNPELDADLPSPLEIKLVGNNSFMKALWLFSFAFVEALRPMSLKKLSLFDKWTFLNLSIQAVFITGLIYFFGWQAYLYLFFSTLFSVGLHPLGARWIQEHFIIKSPQETYSYYGILNKTAFNVGYHNEHHDFMLVPWSRLPQVKKMAPEFYDTLHHHTSWTKLLFQFIFDPKLAMYSRIIRQEAVKPTATMHDEVIKENFSKLEPVTQANL